MQIAAVDPGKVNPAIWIGTCMLDEKRVRTYWGAAGDDIIEHPTEEEKEKSFGKKKKKKGEKTLCEIGVKIGDLITKKCIDAKKPLQGVIVESPSTFNGKGGFVNVGAVVEAGATYGYLCGKGIPNVKMSHSRTKSKAIDFFADALGIADRLEQRVPGVDKVSKAKNRLVNKRNAKLVVTELLRVSGDEVGLALLEKHKSKKDDICDAILLACGYCMDLSSCSLKKKQRRRRRQKEEDVEEEEVVST
jgi:hypothetical protein